MTFGVLRVDMIMRLLPVGLSVYFGLYKWQLSVQREHCLIKTVVESRKIPQEAMHLFWNGKLKSMSWYLTHKGVCFGLLHLPTRLFLNDSSSALSFQVEVAHIMLFRWRFQ